MTVRAWVSVTNELMEKLANPEESFSRWGVKLIAAGVRSGPGAHWWEVEFDPTGPYARIGEAGGFLPVTYCLGEDGKPRVKGQEKVSYSIPLEIYP